MVTTLEDTGCGVLSRTDAFNLCQGGNNPACAGVNLKTLYNNVKDTWAGAATTKYDHVVGLGTYGDKNNDSYKVWKSSKW